MKVRNVLIGTALVGAALPVGRWSSRREGREVDAELFGEVNRGHGPEADRFFTGRHRARLALGGGGPRPASSRSAGRRRAAANAFAAAGAAWLAGQGLKRVANRPRPYEADAEGTRAAGRSAARVIVAEQPSGRAHRVHRRSRDASWDSARSRADRAHRARRRPSRPHASTWASTTPPTWSSGLLMGARSAACGPGVRDGPPVDSLAVLTSELLGMLSSPLPPRVRRLARPRPLPVRGQRSPSRRTASGSRSGS